MAIFKKHFPLLLALIGFLVLLPYLNRPLTGQHDWNSVYFGQAARNHLRYGLLTTKLGVVTNAGFPSATLGYYTHHPILMPLMLAGSLAVFGINDWAIRLVAAVSAALLIYFLTRLSNLLYGRFTAMLVGILLIFSPMLRYYGTIPIHETAVLGWLGLTFWAYFSWLKTSKPRFFYLTCLGLTLSQLTSWAGYYLSVYLPLYALIFSHRFFRRSWPQFTILFVIAPIMFLLFKLHIYWLTGASGQASLWQAFLFRVNAPSATQIFGFNLTQFLLLQSRWMVIYFTRISVILGSLWLIRFIYQLIKRRPISLSVSAPLPLLIFGFTHNAIFRQQAFIHDYTLIYLLPFFALTSGIMLYQLLRLLLRRSIVAAVIFTLIVLIFFVTERRAYLQALYHSGDNNPAYNLSKTLNQLTPPSAQILLLNTELMRFYDVFFNFYSDRQITAADNLPENLSSLSTFDYVVIPQSHDYVTKPDRDFLYRHFAVTDTRWGQIFTTQKL